MNFKINDLVKLKKSTNTNEVFIVVGDKTKPWVKASPYKQNNLIYVDKGKDFILLKKFNSSYVESEENGLHVNENDIELL